MLRHALPGRSHDLTPASVVAIFADDLRRRGLKPLAPVDPFTDQAWKAQILASYTRRFAGTLAAALAGVVRRMPT